jgi:rSAM/selenodomain-associated transferase 1
MRPAIAEATTLPACAIAVMAKASSQGRTKTRLAPPLSYEEAADLNTSFLQDVVANIARAAKTASIGAYVAYGPPGSERFFRDNLGEDVGLIEAWLGGFGDCLLFTIEALLARGHRAACVLNSDSPSLPGHALTELADVLAEPGDRAVIGPAEDGGYYVLGLKAPHRRLFEDIAWSTDAVFAQTMDRAAEIGLPVHVLPTWYDVDDAASLRRLCDELFGDGPGGGPLVTAAHTRALLERMIGANGLSARLHPAGAR